MDWVFAIVSWTLLGISAVAVLRMLGDRFVMRGTYGPTRYDEMRTTTSLLGFQARRILILRVNKWILFWIGSAALAHHFQHSERPWSEMGVFWWPMIALMVGCVQFFGQMRPGAILVLGASNEEAMTLQRRLMDRLFPHRPISLIEGGHLSRSIRINAGDVYRITLGDWEEAVWSFSRAVLVIVVDLREMTPPVDRELRFIATERLQYKTVLLDPHGVSNSYPDLAGCRLVTTPEDCVAVVECAFSGYDTLLSDIHPLRDLTVKRLERAPSG